MSRSVSFRPTHIERNPVPIPDHLDICLTDVEAQLCVLLDDCTKHLAENGIHTACRIAGGWVRDKVGTVSFFDPSNEHHVDHLQLLGSDSHDIDIALENMTGEAFALKFTEFVGRLKHLPVKSVAVVKSNPGQSKHLETAKTTVLGLDLDFVNLRDEAYAADSRIPTKMVSRLSSSSLYEMHPTSLALLKTVADFWHAVARRIASGYDDKLTIL
jgi:tRNA nucleotidyltransferase (CCA-adding enzyme)